MTNLKEILNNYLLLIVVFAVILVVIAAVILLFNKFSFKKKIYLYGLLMDLKNNEIFALTLIIVNFLLLCYVLIMKLPLSPAIAILSFLLVFIAFVLVKSFINILVNSVINGVSIGLIYLANLVNQLRLASNSKAYLVLQIGVNVFGLLFYIFTMIKFVRNIRYTGGKSEKNN